MPAHLRIPDAEPAPEVIYLTDGRGLWQVLTSDARGVLVANVATGYTLEIEAADLPGEPGAHWRFVGREPPVESGL